jgi:hypothetical protein
LETCEIEESISGHAAVTQVVVGRPRRFAADQRHAGDLICGQLQPLTR